MRECCYALLHGFGTKEGRKNVLYCELDLNSLEKQRDIKRYFVRPAPARRRKASQKDNQGEELGEKVRQRWNLSNIMLARRDICKTTIVIKYFMQIYSYVVILEFSHSQCSSFHKLLRPKQSSSTLSPIALPLLYTPTSHSLLSSNNTRVLSSDCIKDTYSSFEILCMRYTSSYCWI